ncbi:MAG: hypothetical protein V3T09_08400 [bacterium]
MSKEKQATKLAEKNIAKLDKKNIKNLVSEELRNGLDNQEILKVVWSKFPNSSTSLASIGGYRYIEKQKDPSILSIKELKKKRFSINNE